MSERPPPLASRAHLSEWALVLLLGGLAAFGPLAIDMYLPAFKAIAVDLRTEGATVGWTLAAYFVGLAVGQVVIGPLTDRLGRRGPLQVGLVVFTLASVGAALAPSIGVLVGVRLLQALGGAACVVIARSTVRDLYRGAEAARVNSRLVLVMGAAPIVAPLLGGAVLGWAGWRAIFAVLAACGALAFVVVRRALPETAPAPTPRGPALRHALLGDRGFVVHALMAAASSAGMFAYITGAPVVFLELGHVAPGDFGWYFGANAAAYIGSCQLNAALVQRRAPAAVLRWGRGGLIAAGAVVLVAATARLPWWVTELGFFGYLFSLGLVMPNTIALALEHQGARAGGASAWLGALQFALSAAASAVVSSAPSASALPAGLTMVTLACAGGLLGLVPRRDLTSSHA